MLLAPLLFFLQLFMTIPVKLLLLALGFGFPAAVVLQYVAGARTVHGFQCIGILQVTCVDV